MIPIEALEALDAIDRKGSFAAAAEELHRVPSALTYTIKKLEERLSIQLFDREKQRAKLTPTGRLVLEKGREILHKVRQLEDQAQRAESGWEKQLRIVIDTILPCEPFWPLIRELQEQQPWLDIQILDEALSGSWEALMNERADLIIGVSGDEPAGGLWERRYIGNMRGQLCCSPQHPANQLKTPINRSQLEAFTHIVISDSAQHLPQRNLGLLGMQQTLAVSNLAQKLSALVNGMGISHLPDYLAKEMVATGQLNYLKSHHNNTPLPFFMCWKKNNIGKANQWLQDTIITREVLAPYFTSDTR